MRAFARHRRWVAWLCAAAVLWLGLVAQQHALSHAAGTAHASGEPDLQTGDALPCAQCLQFAGFDSMLVTPAQPVALFGAPAFEPPPLGLLRHAETFVAYASRAPPAV